MPGPRTAGRLDRLERVVGVPELDGVGAEHLLVDEQVLGARADRLGPRAVVGEHHLIADVDGGEASGRGPDVEQGAIPPRPAAAPWPGSRGQRSRLEIRAQLAARQAPERAVTHAGQGAASPSSGAPSSVAAARAARVPLERGARLAAGIVGEGVGTCAASRASARSSASLTRERPGYAERPRAGRRSRQTLRGASSRELRRARN